MTIFLLAVIALLLIALLFEHVRHADVIADVELEVKILREAWERLVDETTRKP